MRGKGARVGLCAYGYSFRQGLNLYLIAYEAIALPFELRKRYDLYAYATLTMLVYQA